MIDLLLLLVLFGPAAKESTPFEIARVLVRFNHIARCIVNANHRIM